MNNNFIKHEDPATIHKLIKKFSERECPFCHETYIIGKTGVVEGCDNCLNIIRDRNGMIVEVYHYTAPEEL